MAKSTEEVMSNTFSGHKELVGADKLLRAILDLGISEITPKGMQAILDRFCKFNFHEVHGESKATEYSSVFKEMRENQKHNESFIAEEIRIKAVADGCRGGDTIPTISQLKSATQKIESKLNRDISDILSAFSGIKDIRIEDKTLNSPTTDGGAFISPQFFIRVEL